MKKITLLLSTIIFGFSLASVQAKPQFNQDQLRQFHETNRCANCDLSSFQFAENDLNHSGALLHDANLSNIIASRVNFAFSYLVNANFTGAALLFSNFSNSNVTNAHFEGADLYKANFFGATGFNPRNANICDAILPDGSIGKCP